MNNNYCVYVHRDANGDIFYVGSGTEQRPSKSSKRTKEWVDKALSNWSHEIVLGGLTKDQALDLEQLLINKLKNSVKLCNKLFTVSKTKSIPQELLDSLEYSEESPSGLIDFKTKNPRGTISNQKGTRKKYWIISYKSSIYSCHRIILSKINDNIDNLVVDHLDGNSLNNKLENLRLTDLSGNSKNKPKNSSEDLVVVVDKIGEKPYTRLRFTIDKKQTNIYFRQTVYDDAYFCAVCFKYKIKNKLINSGYLQKIFPLTDEYVEYLWGLLSDKDKTCLNEKLLEFL